MHEIQVYSATFGVTCSVVLDSSALLSVYSIYIIVYYIIIYKYLKNIFSCLFDKFDWHLDRHFSNTGCVEICMYLDVYFG